MPQRQSWRLSSLLLTGAAGGLLAGWGSYTLLQIQRLALERMVFLGRHALWMKPLIESLIIVAALGAAWLAARVIGRKLSPPVAIGITVALAAISGLYLLSAIHPGARLLLAGGIGVQAARWPGRWLSEHEGAVRRGAMVLLGGWAVLTGAILLRGPWTFDGPSAHDAAAPADSPNLLLLVLDTVRARSMGLYGYHRPTTPELERFAESALIFDRAYSPAPWTLPAHASLFTGRPPGQHQADWRQPLGPSPVTLAEHLGSRGYQTVGVVANMGYAGWESGLARGFETYYDHPISLGQLVSESPFLTWILNRDRVRDLVGTDQNLVRKSAAEVNRRFLDWLSERQVDQPFFAFLNYYDAHGPYLPPEPYRSRFIRSTEWTENSPLHRYNADPFGPVPSADQIAAEQDAYDASIAWLDRELGRLFDELERRELLDRTVVVITSDHGEEFGEHGLFDHGNSLFIDNLHVPLLIRAPGLSPGRWSDPVSLTDLATTLHRLLGGSGTDPYSGRSLTADGSSTIVSAVSFAPRLPTAFPVSRGDMWSAISGTLHYILNGDGVEELYDLSDDPLERHDLMPRPEYAAARDSLRAAIPPPGASPR